MNLFRDLLFLIIKTLIAIGDGVIFIFNFLIILIRKPFDLIQNRINLIKKRRKRKVKKSKVVFERPKKNKKSPHPFLTKAKYFSFGFLFSAIFIFIPILFLIFIQDLPHPQELATQEIAQTTKIYDRHGVLLYEIYANQNRTVVPLSGIPDNLKKATIAIEDKNFYSTPGFDLEGIGRSIIADISGKSLQGGSTITQQLIKARLLTPEISISRKIKELVLAVWTERIYTKNQILEMYLNQVPYGGTSWGAETASETYFGRSVKNLDLAECAFLAGLPQAPTIYSPYGQFPNLWKQRQTEVLSNMKSLGFITDKQRDQAEKEKLSFNPPQEILHAPYFVMYIRDLLVQRYGLAMVERGGLSVTTSLDLKTQDETQQTVKDEVDKDAGLNLTNGAALITNPGNGDILAMVGGRDYNDPNGGNFNVTTALRQPGSTIKVITYSAALMNGFTAATLINDSPVSFSSPGSPVYSPVNYDGKYHGIITLRQALANSINVAAVKTLNKIGIPTMVNLAKKMGITTWGDPSDYGLSITLGAAEVKMTDMATVYGVFANKGERVDLNPILKLTDARGDILEEKNQVKKERILPDTVAFIMNDILADNKARSMEFGTNSPLNIPGYKISVKTGTTDNKRDNWTIGYTPSLLVAVWVGNNNNSPMNPVLASGITGAAPIWNRIMQSLLKNSLENEGYPVPSGIVEKPCFGGLEYFIEGTENQGCRFSTATPSATTILSSPVNQ